MMFSANLTQKPNTPIFLEETIITHIDGHCLPIPCSGRVTFHLSPRISCRIDSDNLPRQLPNSWGKKRWVTKSERNKFVPQLKNALDGIAKVVEQNV